MSKEYPECEKLLDRGEERIHVLNFVEHLQVEEIDVLEMISSQVDRAVMEYLGLDPDKIEKERQAMIRSLQG